MGLIKGATLFFLGMSCVLFMTRAFEIEPSVPNAVQYIKSIFLTQDGSNATTTRIALDGYMGNGNFSGTLKATTVNGTTISGNTINGNIINGTTVNATTVNGTTVNANAVTATTITGTTICLVGDTSANKCRTSWPTDGISATGETIYVGGSGGSLWSTGANGAIYYNLGKVGIGTNNPTEQLQIGDYAWIGRNTNPLASATGGTFLKLYGIKSAFATPGDDEGIKTYTPNIQLNYTEGVYGNQYVYDNWKIVGGKNFGIEYNNGNLARTNFLSINNNGNIGIGTKTPTAKLEVKGVAGKISINPNDASAMSTININAYSTGSSGFDIGHAYIGGGMGFIKSKNEPFVIVTDDFAKPAVPSFYISTGGKVGIGTISNPLDFKLKVEADANGRGILSSGSIVINNGSDSIPDFEIYGQYNIKFGWIGVAFQQGIYVNGHDGGSLGWGGEYTGTVGYTGGTALTWNTGGNVKISKSLQLENYTSPIDHLDSCSVLDRGKIIFIQANTGVPGVTDKLLFCQYWYMTPTNSGYRRVSL